MLKHQFCIYPATEDRPMLNKFSRIQFAGFTIASEQSLPVVKIFCSEGSIVGVFLGWPIEGSELLQTDISCRLNYLEVAERIEHWLYSLAGRWLAIISVPGLQAVYLDALALQSTVYHCTSKTIASTGGLINAKLMPVYTDKELINDDLWYPAGTTAHLGVRRLLANHRLNLQSFTTERHWPVSAERTDLNWQQKLTEVARLMRQQFTAVSLVKPAYVGLTAGMDSRAMMACCRGQLEHIQFWTREDRSAASFQDIKTAAELASRFKLSHRQISNTKEFDLSAEEIQQFFVSTGWVIGGSPLKSSKLVDSIGDVFAFSGLGGAIGKAYYVDKLKPPTAISAESLLSLSELPHKTEFLSAMKDYVKGLPELPVPQILALFYLENRVGAYSAVNRYGFQSGIVFLSPFSHRRIIEIMMSIPVESQKLGAFHQKLVETCWPELLQVPINQPLNLLNYLQQLVISGLRKMHCRAKP